ncbi:MAG: GGDEF domain-containing protein [Candidatus Sericytochromatia bacterium]|nr:GGDEF domain-containing protein [Candidatus Sericytochromatia bacterium]
MLLPDRSAGAPWADAALTLLAAETPADLEAALLEALTQPGGEGPRLVWLTPKGASPPARAAQEDGRRRFFEALAASRREVLALRARCDAQDEALAEARAQCRAVAVQALTDALTGLPNRRALLEQADRLAAVATRYGTPFALVLLDVDHFKACNDLYGHAAGDAVLRGVAGTLAASVRDADVAARYGGEEFVVLCPNTSLGAAAQLAERLRRAVEETLPLPAPDALIELPPGVTASVGVATWQAGDRSFEAVLRRADAALYQAKAGGRNRVMLAPLTEG